MIVLDTSAAVSLIIGSPAAAEAVRGRQITAPHLIDAEVAHAVRGLTLGGRLTEQEARTVLRRWSTVALKRREMASLLNRVLDLRHNLSGYDAMFVATAERLGVPVVTCDAGLAAGGRAVVDVVLVPSTGA